MAPARHELTENQWLRIKDLLPIDHGRAGPQPRPNRLMLNAILWVLKMVEFDHEKLEVYCVAVEYADAAAAIAAKLKAGNAHIRDQLRRSSNSVINNVAEGAGEFQPAEKARFYRIALRSCTESATLHTCQRRQLADLDGLGAARKLLKRVVEMLTRLVQSVGQRNERKSGPGPGPGPGPGRSD